MMMSDLSELWCDCVAIDNDEYFVHAVGCGTSDEGGKSTSDGKGTEDTKGVNDVLIGTVVSVVSVTLKEHS